MPATNLAQTNGDAGGGKDGKAYQNALSVLRTYFDLHTETGADTEQTRNQFSPWLEEIATADRSLGGTVQVARSSKTENRDKNFADLFRGRTSVREYTDTAVDRALIDEAIGIASKTPSICNRQPSRVR